MSKFLIFTAATIIFISCASPEGKKDAAVADTTGSSSRSKEADLPAGSSYFKTVGDSLEIPSFEIEVNLSKKASEKLLRDKETIIVAAWFAGQPKDTTTKEYAESGEMFINAAQVELNAGRIAKLEGVKFSKARYDSLASKDISVLINVFSGRKSTQNNVLDCAILSEKMSVVKGRKFVLAGKLINEPDSLAK